MFRHEISAFQKITKIHILFTPGSCDPDDPAYADIGLLALSVDNN